MTTAKNIFVCAIMGTSISQAATIQVSKDIDFTDAWVPEATTNGDLGTSYTATSDTVTIDPAGSTDRFTYGSGDQEVSFDINLSITRSDGQAKGSLYYYKAFQMGYQALTAGGADVGTLGFDSKSSGADQVTFSISNITTGSAVDRDSLKIQFASLGMYLIGDHTESSLNISSTGTSAITVNQAAGFTQFTLDDSIYTDIDGYEASLTYASNDGLQYYFDDNKNNTNGGLKTSIQFNTVAVPEPSATALLGLGGMSLLIRRKR